MDNNKLYEAALLLKTNCEENFSTDKCNCPFAFSDEEKCYCMVGVPKTHKIKKPSRWTEEDIALAKALKAFGVTHILCDEFGCSFYRIKNASGSIMFSSYLPGDAFCNLSNDEVSIDDIIKDGEQNG